MRYQTKPGDSPTRIARAYGIPMSALINANAHKPTHMVANQRTWRELRHNETINVPVGVGVGDAVTDAVNAPHFARWPVPSIERRSGLRNPERPRCHDRRKVGQRHRDSSESSRSKRAGRVQPSSIVVGSCRAEQLSRKSSGTYGFSAAGSGLEPRQGRKRSSRGASRRLELLFERQTLGHGREHRHPQLQGGVELGEPSNPVPINTGNYEPIVQIALALALNTSQSNVPPGCGAVPTATTPTPAATQPPPIQATTAPSSSPYVDPCRAENVAKVCDLQRSLRVTADGKYGPATASAARSVDPSAPGACSPRPTWWKPAGQSNCPGASPVPTTAFTPQTTVPAPTPGTVTVPAPVAALATINPCDQSSLEVVYAAQRALGVSPDGKYGNDTASAAASCHAERARGLQSSPGMVGASRNEQSSWRNNDGHAAAPAPSAWAARRCVNVSSRQLLRQHQKTCLPNTSQAQPPIVVAPVEEKKLDRRHRCRRNRRSGARRPRRRRRERQEGSQRQSRQTRGARSRTSSQVNAPSQKEVVSNGRIHIQQGPLENSAQLPGHSRGCEFTARRGVRAKLRNRTVNINTDIGRLRDSSPMGSCCTGH